MKTQKLIILKAVPEIMMVSALLLTLLACSNQQENTDTRKNNTSVSKTSTKQPGMEIHMAALMGDVKAIHQHILAGSDLNKKDEYGSTPLIIAATFGKTDVARALVEAGADVNRPNNEGSTPLHIATFFCRPEIVKILLDHGADKNLKNNFGSTALESITVPFDSVRSIYDQFSKDLGPLGLKLDYKYIKATRPKIAEMLK